MPTRPDTVPGPARETIAAKYLDALHSADMTRNVYQQGMAYAYRQALEAIDAHPTVDDLILKIRREYRLIETMQDYVGGFVVTLLDDNLHVVLRTERHPTLLAAFTAAVDELRG